MAGAGRTRSTSWTIQGLATARISNLVAAYSACLEKIPHDLPFAGFVGLFLRVMFLAGVSMDDALRPELVKASQIARFAKICLDKKKAKKLLFDALLTSDAASFRLKIETALDSPGFETIVANAGIREIAASERAAQDLKAGKQQATGSFHCPRIDDVLLSGLRLRSSDEEGYDGVSVQAGEVLWEGVPAERLQGAQEEAQGGTASEKGGTESGYIKCSCAITRNSCLNYLQRRVPGLMVNVGIETTRGIARHGARFGRVPFAELGRRDLLVLLRSLREHERMRERDLPAVDEHP